MEKQERYYDILNLNKLFGISSIVFLLLLVWTFADDYDRTWKDYQHEFRRLDAEHTADLLEDEEGRVAELEDYKKASADLEQAKADLEQKSEDLSVLTEQRGSLEGEHYKVEQELAFIKSKYDAARFRHEEAMGRNHGDSDETRAILDELGADVHQKTLIVQDVEASLTEKKKEISQLTASVDDAEKRTGALSRQIDIHNRKLTKIDPGTMSIANRVANMVRDLPVIDFMNPYLKINQIIIPDIKEELNFTQMPKVDRCTTCHLGIDKAGFEDAPQPYTTHPNLDLFLASSSPHPMEDYGCTSCHAGRGRGTDFTTVAHTPSSHEQEEEWVEEYGWYEMHHWETPMYASQYIEAGCLKCHSGQPHITGADDLNIGLALFEKASCFGCHVVERYEGKLPQRTGPNLTHLASKTSKEWAYRWIQEPRSFRDNTWMPHFFDIVGENDEEERVRKGQEIHAIVEYLFDHSQDLALGPMPRLGNKERGEYLFNNLGCEGCHKIQEAPDETPYTLASLRQEHGPNLIGLGSKTTQQWLFNWLKNPKTYHPETRMPNLRVSDVEAADLASYLSSFSSDTFMSSPISPPNDEMQSDIAFQFLSKMNSEKVAGEQLAAMDMEEKLDYNGGKLIQHYGCTGCHLVPGFENAKRIGVALDGEGSKALTKLDFGYVDIPHNKIEWFTQKVKHPRSFDVNKVINTYDALRMPDFGFTDEEVDKIVTVLIALNNDHKREKPHSAHKAFVEAGQWIVKSNNCQGCHIIEGRGGDILTNFIAPEYGPPNLNTQGAKVQPAWLRSFFEEPTIIRPNLLVRMPSFELGDGHWNSLIKYFQYTDDQTTPYEGDYHPQKNSVAFRAGVKLHEMGACNNCHFYGTTQPLQTPQTWAPNMALTKERLRPDWVMEWLRDPQSIMPGTKMPKPYIPAPEELATADASEVFGRDILRLSGDDDAMLRGLTDYVYAIPGKIDISAEIKVFFDKNGYGFLEGEEEADDWDDWDDEEWEDEEEWEN